MGEFYFCELFLPSHSKLITIPAQTLSRWFNWWPELKREFMINIRLLASSAAELMVESTKRRVGTVRLRSLRSRSQWLTNK